MIIYNKKNIRLRRCRKFRSKYKHLNKFCLVINKTLNHIYAQIIYFKNNKSFVVVYANTLEKVFNIKNIYTGNIKAAKIIGKIIAIRCLKKNILYVIFDRSGFKYHGRIKALADSARKTGLIF